MKNVLFRSARFSAYFAGALLLLEGRAYAYVDPATTSYVVQIVAGIVIACGTGIGIFWNRMRRKMKKRNADEAPADKISSENESAGGVMTAEDLLNDETDNSDR